MDPRRFERTIRFIEEHNEAACTFVQDMQDLGVSNEEIARELVLQVIGTLSLIQHVLRLDPDTILNGISEE